MTMKVLKLYFLAPSIEAYAIYKPNILQKLGLNNQNTSSCA